VVDRLWSATQAFWDSLTEIHWLPLLLAIGAHVLKLACTSRAWRNVLAAAYPDEPVPWRKIFAAYAAGVGVNAILPARGGDVLRVVLAHRAIPGSTYTTIVSSTVVLTFVDFTLALAVFVWALTQDVLPGLDVLPSLPTFDYAWLVEQGRWSAAAAAVLGLLLVAFAVWAWRRWSDFKARVAQAFSVLHPPSRYVRTVASWQLADWSLRLVTIWLFLGAFGIEQSVRNVLLVQATLSLATLVPATPGGIGTEQALVVYAFRGADIARSTLLAFSVGMKLTLTAVNVVIGFAAILLTLGSFRFRHAIEEPAEDTPA
jgi:uncharacterized membrane protein YbhN (UPF0104 family)